ncbi:TetR/AcrR family transcriptional regulator [Acanthopleuribacter pedis]|uniref:TetR/AcrR family transcriptional regulator n=1 Tax=Acanthopleuribacter pedis TaxID=442870 RepID=A0A8J7QET2_9BACT|nr:TetR/AcrR family transcriptional regulator [Acanthopleuribacter pedis]MBO1323337.1 TetR/AcrR family transcriptional regulator [Acanthopleuribacter pedis]
MKKTEKKRRELIEKLAAYLLANGLQQSSLRRLAAAIGTSDRMLLHYFTNKEDLMNAALSALATQLEDILTNTRAEPMPFEVLVPHLAAFVADPRIQPFTRLWLEITARASAGETTMTTVASEIMTSFYQWVSNNLRVEDPAFREPLAGLALATVEGCVLLEAVGGETKIKSAMAGLALLTKGTLSEPEQLG